jgi:predicted DNA-binding transcriptional regulator YafY
VSPQRITHYREAWYLDACDEKRDALRCFSIDRILRATVLEEPAVDVPEAELDQHYASARMSNGTRSSRASGSMAERTSCRFRTVIRASS